MEINNGELINVSNEDIINGEFKFPKGLTKIGMEAFNGCSSLREITIPEGVTEIGYKAFKNCSSLREITIPEGVRSIEIYAFEGCSILEKIYVNKENEIFEGIDGILYKKDKEGSTLLKYPEGKKNLKSYTIPEGVTNIERAAFEGCSSLEEVTISEGVTEIGYEAFKRCSSLEKITISEGVTTIETGAFEGCSSLEKITIPEGVTEMGYSVFEKCNSLREITILKGVTKIGYSAFKRCSSLEKITIPEGVTSIETDSFEECSSLEKITIPEGVTTIERGAFGGCSSLKEISIPSSVKFIGKENFDYNNVIYDNEKKTTIFKNDEKFKKSSKYIPMLYLLHLFETEKTESFFKNTDFRAFNSNIPNLKGLLSKHSEEEQLNFFKFAVCLGCFSKEKILDKNLKETEVTVGQKASALLAKLIKTPQMELGKYQVLFDPLSFKAKANHEFLEFIALENKNYNLELLVRLESECPGIFAKTMTGFNEVEKYRKTLDNDGTTKTVSWEDALKKFYTENKYVSVTEETQDIAETYSTKGLKQEVFDRGVELRKQAQKEGIPSHILGKEIKELSILEQLKQLKQKTAKELGETQEILEDLYSKQFTYEWLDKTNAKNGIIGLYVSCCANITNTFYGKDIAINSIIKKDVQNLVVKDAKGEIISKGTIYVDEEHGYGVFNDFELNEKYREHEDRSDGDCGEYDGDYKDESELTESQKKQRKERDLIFNAFQRGIEAFIEEYNKQHPGNPIKQINVGMGYNKLKRNVKQFEEATELLTVPVEYSFKDVAHQQFILYKREEKKIESQQEEKEK